jgi:type VI protein secretion system component Hcp
MVITKTIDENTPLLLTRAMIDSSFGLVRLRVSSVGPHPLDFFSVTMSNVKITSYLVTGTDQLPTESITLHFNSAQGQYIPISPAGNALTPLTWSVSENGGLGNPLCQ